MEFWEHLKLFTVGLFYDVPICIYKWLLIIFCLCALLVFLVGGLKNKWRIISDLLLIEYLFMIYSSTVFYRPYNEEIGSNLIPFWSYFAYDNIDRPELLSENFMNIAVFVPMGILLGSAIQSITWRKVLLIGGGISVSIEAMQFFLKRGFAETDDVMHNTLGCMIGYGVYSILRMGYERFHKRSVAVL